MGIDRKRLYKKWKKAGMGMAGLNAVKRRIHIEGPEAKREFPTEGDIRNLILVFRKYDKNADGPMDWIQLWFGIFLIAAFFNIGLLAFPNMLAGVITENAVLEIAVISGGIIVFQFLILLVYYRRYSKMDSLASIPDSPKGVRPLIFECVIAIIGLMAVTSYIIRSYDGFGFFA